MDIPDDYFMAIADDLTDEQAQAAIKELQKLFSTVLRKVTSRLDLSAFGYCWRLLCIV